jgi:hypothetical protein
VSERAKARSKRQKKKRSKQSIKDRPSTSLPCLLWPSVPLQKPNSKRLRRKKQKIKENEIKRTEERKRREKKKRKRINSQVDST